jgi:putative DNA primase/helicase
MLETRTAYTALVELVAEQVALGVTPKVEWLQRIESTRAEHPEWITHPVPDVPLEVPPAPPPASSPPRAVVPLQQGARVLVLLDDDVNRIVTEVLLHLGSRLKLFQSSGKLLELQNDSGKDIKFLIREATSSRMVAVTSTRAWLLAGSECRFGIEKPSKDTTPTAIPQITPDWIGRAITSLPEFPHIPTLTALAQAPTLRPDGELIHEPGYDKSTGILLASDLKVTVPEALTKTAAEQALERLTDLLRDFDFVNHAGKSAWLSGFLSVCCRHTFDGPAPIFIIDASKRGSGKTTLVDLASTIAMGGRAPKMFYTSDDIEMDKRISALAIAGDSMVLLDNVVGKLASPPLDAAVTSTWYQGRLLGKSEMTSLSMKAVWFVTGNGIIIGADTARRALLIRLEPQCDYPEDRTGPRQGETWKYPDLLSYAKSHRAELLSDALTVISAYIKAGRPGQKLTPMGSFDGWSGTIRSAIVWAGGADPCATTKDARQADLDDLALRVMVECWPVADGVKVTASTLLEWAELTAPLGADPHKREVFEKTRTIREMWRSALLEWLPAKKGDLPSARELGYALRGMAGAIVGKHKIEKGDHTMSGVPWSRVTTMTMMTIDPGTNDSNKASSLSVVK